MHGPGESAAQMGQRLVEVASRHSMPGQELGLSHETRNLTAEVPAAEMIQAMRRKMHRDGDAAAPLAVTPRKRSNWSKAAIAGGCALLISAAWLLLRSRI
jgi:hypothetical protein